MSRQIRTVVTTTLALVVGVLALPLAIATAQDASPEAAPSVLAGTGLPVFEVTFSSEGLDVPAEVPAGPVLFVFHNQTENWVVASMSLLPEGTSDEAYLGALLGEGMPEWAAGMTVAGGYDAPPMSRNVGVIVLDPGLWSLGAGGSESPVTAVETIEVTGTVDTGAVDSIPADMVVEMSDHAFDIPDTVAAGPQAWRLTNTGRVLHHLVLLTSDRLYTADEVATGIAGEFSGTPVPDGFSLMEAGDVFVSSALSEGKSMWVEMDLEPGFYVALCFLADPGSDMPHLFTGMIDTFEVTMEEG